MGLPEELTEEEKAKEAAAATQKAEAAKKKGSFVTVKPVSGTKQPVLGRAGIGTKFSAQAEFCRSECLHFTVCVGVPGVVRPRV